VAAGYEMRVSDAEREAAAAELREHFASGRLNQDELEERLTSAFAAKTRGDLNALFTDLPSSGHGRAGAGASGSGQASGPLGPGTANWGPWANSGAHSDWQAHGDAWRASAGRGIGRLVFTSVLVWVLFIVGILGVFGIGTGRPFGVVLIIAAFALLRRLLFMIFGRRRARGGRGGGPRRRR
jgi:Domain of unknown function (DUF1707)